MKVDKFLCAHGKKYITALVKGEDSAVPLDNASKKGLNRAE